MIGFGFVGDSVEGLAIARDLVAHPDAVVAPRCPFSAAETRELARLVVQSLPPAPPGTIFGGVLTENREGTVTILLSSFDREFGESVRNRWGVDRIDIEYGVSVHPKTSR